MSARFRGQGQGCPLLSSPLSPSVRARPGSESGFGHPWCSLTFSLSFPNPNPNANPSKVFFLGRESSDILLDGRGRNLRAWLGTGRHLMD